MPTRLTHFCAQLDTKWVTRYPYDAYPPKLQKELTGGQSLTCRERLTVFGYMDPMSPKWGVTGNVSRNTIGSGLRFTLSLTPEERRTPILQQPGLCSGKPIKSQLRNRSNGQKTLKRQRGLRYAPPYRPAAVFIFTFQSPTGGGLKSGRRGKSGLSKQWIVTRLFGIRRA